MRLPAIFHRPITWSAIAAVLGVAFLALAVNNGVYEATSPSDLPYAIALRKAYSIIAFAAIGIPVALARRAAGRQATPADIGLLMAAYSAIIEVMQYAFDPPPEGLAWNAFDVACGYVGGVFGTWIAARIATRVHM